MIARTFPPALVLAALAHPASAQDSGIELGAAYTADVVSGLSGAADSKARYLGNLDLIADLDLDRLLGAENTVVHVHVLQNHGARPNDAIGTLQGVDNIEVPAPGTRLFEAWVARDFGSYSLLAGLYDLNGEFYANEAASLLIAPPFGIGSELAATGPNGPSIFPSTTLAVRLAVPLSADGGDYVRVAVLNADASTIGDSDGVDLSFDEGLLGIAQFGTDKIGGIELAIGLWGYTKEREQLFGSDPAGPPQTNPSWGGYIDLAGQAWGSPGAGGRWFARGGFADHNTTPYDYGAQLGILVEPSFSGREGSAMSLGIHHAGTDVKFREMLRADGIAAALHETAIEATFAEPLTDFLTVQPDLQFVINPGGVAHADPALVASLRVTIAL